MSGFMNMAGNAAQQYMSHPQGPHPTHSPPQAQFQSSPSPYQPGPPQQHYQGPPPPPNGAPPPPSCLPPWIAIWDHNTHRYYFENTQTRFTQWEYPGSAPAPPMAHNSYETVAVKSDEKHKGGSGYGKVALGAAAGLAGGALLAHEGHKVHEHWEEDKYRAEEKFSRPFEGGHDDYRREYGYAEHGRRPEYLTEERTEYIDNRPGYVRESETTYYDDDYRRREHYGYERRDDDFSYSERVEERVEDIPDDTARWAGRQEQRVEDFPDNAARWAGEKVQEVEDIPEDIEDRWDRAEDGVEGFGDRLEDDFDDGRQEQYDDDDDDGSSGGGW